MLEGLDIFGNKKKIEKLEHEIELLDYRIERLNITVRNIYNEVFPTTYVVDVIGNPLPAEDQKKEEEAKAKFHGCSGESVYYTRTYTHYNNTIKDVS